MKAPLLVYILVILIMSGLAYERYLQLKFFSNIFCFLRHEFIHNFRRTAGLESIFDEIQICVIFFLGTYYGAQLTFAMSLGQPNVSYFS